MVHSKGWEGLERIRAGGQRRSGGAGQVALPHDSNPTSGRRSLTSADLQTLLTTWVCLPPGLSRQRLYSSNKVGHYLAIFALVFFWIPFFFLHFNGAGEEGGWKDISLSHKYPLSSWTPHLSFSPRFRRKAKLLLCLALCWRLLRHSAPAWSFLPFLLHAQGHWTSALWSYLAGCGTLKPSIFLYSSSVFLLVQCGLGHLACLALKIRWRLTVSCLVHKHILNCKAIWPSNGFMRRGPLSPKSIKTYCY